MIKLLLLIVIAATAAYPASQLAPLYEALIKDPRTTTAFEVNLPKAVPSEEIPVIVRVLNHETKAPLSLRIGALGDATAILQVHVTDGQPNFHLLQPPTAEVIREFQVLVPILTANFNDAEPEPGQMVTFNGTTDALEIQWKTRVVQFMDLIGAAPSPDMLSWMLEVVQWPKGRAEAAMAVVDEQERSGGPPDNRAAIFHTIQVDARQHALDIIPVLSRLNPMPSAVVSALLGKIEDATEPQAAEAAIFNLSQNPSVNRAELANRLVVKALDKSLRSETRAMAIHGIGLLEVPEARSRLRGLDRDPDDKIAAAAIDIGINNLDLLNYNK